MPFSEPWFTKKSKLQVEQLLYNSFHVDGYFLVNPDYSKENNSVVALYLSVMCSDVLHQFKIVQVCYDFGFYTFLISQFANTNLIGLTVDIESFWTEGCSGQIPNSGHELAIYIL